MIYVYLSASEETPKAYTYVFTDLLNIKLGNTKIYKLLTCGNGRLLNKLPFNKTSTPAIFF